MAGPEQVLRYLGRYTHRIAISNERLLAHRDGEVTFTYKDRKDAGRKKEMTLPKPPRHPRATRAVQGQARVLARRLSPYRGKGPPALSRLPRRPARRRGRHPPLTDPAQDIVALQVAVNHAPPLGSRPESTSGPPPAQGASPETRNPATVPSTAARLPPLPTSRLSPALHTPAAPPTRSNHRLPTTPPRVQST
jgi:hypothetical protein